MSYTVEANIVLSLPKIKTKKPIIMYKKKQNAQVVSVG